MGGVVTVVWREEDGSVQSWAHHTNPTPYRINRIEMCEDPTSYLQGWFKDEAEADEFVQGRDHALYGKLDSVYPISYGLVVIDQVSKQILHSQGYTGYGTQHVVGVNLSWPRRDFWDVEEHRELSNSDAHAAFMNWYIDELEDPNRNVDPNWIPPEDDTWTAAARLRDMVKANRLFGMSMWDKDLEEYRTHTCEEIFGAKHPTVEQVFAWVYAECIERETYMADVQDIDPLTQEPMEDEYGDPVMVRAPKIRQKAEAAGSKGSFATFLYDMSPWLITRFDESPEGYAVFREQLLGLGFEINEAEWDKYVARWGDDEEE